MSLLGIEHHRALDDLLSAERQLRMQGELVVQDFRQLLLETAVRLDGERLEAIRRENPLIPSMWTVAEWREFLRGIPDVRGWGAPVQSSVPTAREQDLLQQIESLQAQLEDAFHQLDEEKRRVEAADAMPNVLSPVAPFNSAATSIELPRDATPCLLDLIEDLKNLMPSLPARPPAMFAKKLGGGRIGGDLKRAYQRYWIALYLVGRWRLSALMELEEVLAGVVGVSSGSGSLRRILVDLTEAAFLESKILTLDAPRTVLKLSCLSQEGEKLFEALFKQKPEESEWTKLIRLHEGDRFTEHTLAVLTFAMHARKRGYATRILPEVQGNAEPDLWIGRSDQQLYVEVELGTKERTTKWRHQAELNGGVVAICAGTGRGRQRLSGDCKLDNISGFATDLEALIDSKYKTVNHTAPLWVEQWQAG